MRLDRNVPEYEGRGKYAILKMRELELYRQPGTFAGLHPDIESAIKTLFDAGLIDFGAANTPEEFFLIRLKDEFALPALEAYAAAAEDFDFEYASEIRELSRRSGKYSDFCKKPD